MSEVVHVTDATFEQEVLKSEVPVLVDFWAEWCAPCKAIGPLIDEMAKSYDGKLKVVKIDVSANQQVPRQYAVRNIPTLMVFKNGELASTQTGALPQTALANFVGEHVA